MSTKKTKLQRDQLDRRFVSIRALPLSSPPSGWIKALRESLGLSASQLAKRLGLPRQNLSRIEKGEKDGSITVATLKKVADALSCDLHIVFVPRQPLQEIVNNRAREVAKKIIERTNIHMNLEKQGADQAFLEKSIQELAEELVRNSDKRLWEEI